MAALLTTGALAAGATAAPRASGALWQGGSLTDWYAPATSQNGSEGGLLALSGTAAGQSSNEVCHTDAPCVKLTATYPFSGSTPGARLVRWNEPRANRAAYYSSWFYVPVTYVLTGDVLTGQFWNLLQFKSVTATRNDPVWSVEAENNPAGGLRLRGIWNSDMAAPGPYPKDAVGWKRYGTLVPAPVPIGRWFQVTSFLRESKDFDGVFKVWLDGTLVLDFEGVRTSYSDCTYNSWCASNEWSVNLYSDGMSPSPARLYVDDAQISLGAPTAVSVLSFRARPARGRVVLRWRSVRNASVLGWNVFRFGGSHVRRENAHLIAAGGQQTFRLTDRRVRRGVAYRYRLQAVHVDGSRSWVATARAVGR